MEASISNISQSETELFEFEALLEIRERDGQRRTSSRPTSRVVADCNNANDDCYIDIEQQGFFVSPLERNCFKGLHNPRVFVIEARWNPSAWNFEVLNTETPRGKRRTSLKII
uniref:DUF3444 domain-containing protein n=1 Tax=Meloidogyne hapla TaxID=6305 RepID=A0A1I8B863_MELHA